MLQYKRRASVVPFRVDPQSYQFVVDKLQARFYNLTRRFKNVENELKKQKDLLAKKLTTSNKVHSLLVAYNIIRGNLEETKSELSAAKFELENTVMKSPIDGMLSDINVDVGDTSRRPTGNHLRMELLSVDQQLNPTGLWVGASNNRALFKT